MKELVKGLDNCTLNKQQDHIKPNKDWHLVSFSNVSQHKLDISGLPFDLKLTAVCLTWHPPYCCLSQDSSKKKDRLWHTVLLKRQTPEDLEQNTVGQT